MPTDDNALPATSVTAPTAPPASPPAPTNQEPAWLPERLARAAETASKKILQDLGVSSVDDLKTIVKTAKEADDAKKSLTDKYADTTKTLDTTSKQLEEANSVIKARAEAEFTSLTKEQQEAVTAIAGDNHAARLKAITALSPTWTKPAAAPATTPAEKPPLQAPGNTSTQGVKPPATPPAPPSTDDAAILAKYEELHKSNPVLAAGYMTQNYQALLRARGVS
jgi:hypothetical protein